MIRLGQLVLDTTPRIAVAVTDRDHNSAIAAAHADVLEVRADEFSDTDEAYVTGQVKRIRDIGLPMILTVRNDPAEGARHALEDSRKYRIFADAITLVDAVDIELSSLIRADVRKLAQDNGKVVIVSKHDFQKTLPDEALDAFFQDAKGFGADIVKIAMQANTIHDVRRLMAFTLKHQESAVITVSLGTRGMISRLALPAMGSLLTYSYISQATAPGQIPLAALQQDFRRYYPDQS